MNNKIVLYSKNRGQFSAYYMKGIFQKLKSSGKDVFAVYSDDMSDDSLDGIQIFSIKRLDGTLDVNTE